MSQDEEIRLAGGNLGGAVRVGDTVRRPVGPWTPAVHALLGHLAGRVPNIPRVLGFDDRGREILSYLPGRVADIDAEMLSIEQMTAVVRWTRIPRGGGGFLPPRTMAVFPSARSLAYRSFAYRPQRHRALQRVLCGRRAGGCL